jgi:hypothetical protein
MKQTSRLSANHHLIFIDAIPEAHGGAFKRCYLVLDQEERIALEN